jgi:kynurenine formamidase
MTVEEFDRLYEEVKSWKRWGVDDERGSLNNANAERVVHAARLVRSGRTVSLARTLDTTPGPDNQKPALHYMTQLGDTEISEPRVNMDFIGTDFHGKSVTHIDALCHCNFRGQLYNGVSATDAISSKGASFGSVMALRDGIVSRGVLMDVPRAQGKEWLEAGTAVTPDDLEAVESAEEVRVGAGDIVLLRSGHLRRQAQMGVWDPRNLSAGLHPFAMRWLADRGIAVLGADGDSDARPSPVQDVESPIHALALAGMGLNLIDNMNLEDIAMACSEEHRWEFLCVIAPLRVLGGTGSPVNPIAIF